MAAASSFCRSTHLAVSTPQCATLSARSWRHPSPLSVMYHPPARERLVQERTFCTPAILPPWHLQRISERQRPFQLAVETNPRVLCDRTRVRIRAKTRARHSPSPHCPSRRWSAKSSMTQLPTSEGSPSFEGGMSIGLNRQFAALPASRQVRHSKKTSSTSSPAIYRIY